MNQALLSSKNLDWCTPQDFFDELNREFHFVLDAAATAKTAKCPMYFTPETDGLSQSWNHGGAVFCNPPYGREIRKWVKKAYEESKQGGQWCCLFQPELTLHGFTTTYTAKQKYALFAGACNLRTKTEILSIERLSRR